jgi:small neutral amino acid transporter SnatA (MarC family)
VVAFGVIVAFGLAIVTVTVVLWPAMRFSGAILRMPRDSGAEPLTRIAGLLLPAIAVQFIGAVRTVVRNG